MKTEVFSIIMASVFFTLFLTSHAYAQCMIVNGTQQCKSPNPIPQPPSIKSDKLVYVNLDKPVVTILGEPNTTVELEITDPSGNIVFSQGIKILPTGNANYTLDISSYKPGIYLAEASMPTGRASTSFAVGLTPTGGKITLNLAKYSYLLGDDMIILGAANSNSIVTLSLIDPNGTVVKSSQRFTDKTGHFSSFDFRIPYNAVFGKWKVQASMGLNNKFVDINVGSAQNNATQAPKYSGPITITIHIDSPLKQFKSGIKTEDVKCADGFIHVIKSENNSPACVTDSSMGRMVRQGWWIWDEKVGDTIVNVPDKKPFDSKDCAIFETTSSIVGTRGFVKDNLPENGTTYAEEKLTNLLGGILQFSIKPNSTANIVFTYDFNSYPGSNCKVTSSDVIQNLVPGRQDASLSELLAFPTINEVNQTMVRLDLPVLKEDEDVVVRLTNVQDLNDHVSKVNYQITSKPNAVVGKSYFIGFWFHSAVIVTVGNDLYNGTALSGPRYD